MRIAALVSVLLLAPQAARGQADSLMARVQAAVQQYERGERGEAMRDFGRFIDIYNARAERLTSREFMAVAIACTYLGNDDPQLFKDALKAYDRAIAADPDNMEARARLAELFLDKYASGEAKATLAETLARNPRYVPALVAEARRRDFDGEAGADSVLAQALEREPENVTARTLRARFLADVENFDGAIVEIDRALRANPHDADALAFAAALRFVSGDSAGFAELRRRYAARYPREAGVEVATAELLGRVRQYGRAAQAAREGTHRDPRNWRAHALLGSNLLRLGDVDDAKRSLETAFAADPYDVWTKNTLDLLDTFGNYDVLTFPRFRVMVEKTESALIGLYLAELADSAFAVFTRRYGYAPSSPVRIEVYRSHADFSVRTVGLAGLGALGVSFGNTIAFDSPAARDAGSFNWGSTAWHELAHTFTLGASGQRVPRWLSEGLSVYEERKARSGWGHNVTPAFLQAYVAGGLQPPSRLNDGFVRPAYPQQVLFSYYQASLVCELIARDWGERALTAMLRAYGEGLRTDEVFRRALNTEPAAFDKRFDAYMRERFGARLGVVRGGEVSLGGDLSRAVLLARAAAQPEHYALQVAVGRQLMRLGDSAAAVVPLQRARSLFPEYGGPQSAYPLLARALASRGDRRGAMEALSTMIALGEAPYDVHVTLADLALQLGDTARAADALDRAMYINPYRAEDHERLASLYARLGHHSKAVRERRAVVALRPVDNAEALYQLAVAYRDGGDTVNARRTVLAALEVAPHFERAQELLLALHGRGGKP